MATKAAESRSYRVLIGLNYPPDNRRAEAGAIVSDLPPSSVPWLLDAGAIEPYDEEQEAQP